MIVGAGSIGSRRARLLGAMGHEVYAVDADMDRTLALMPEVPGMVALSLGNHTVMLDAMDAAFVCTPAHTHLAVAREVIEYGCRALFVEKPLSTSMDGVAELVEECARKGVVTMGACNMRWAYPVSEHLEIAVGAQFDVSAPLASWRAGSESYRANGVVLEAAIHELDLAGFWFGWVTGGVEAEGDEDHVSITSYHSHGWTRVVADWREDAEPMRRVRLALVDAATGPVEVVVANASEEMYRREMGHFMKHVASRTPTTNPIANAAETLRWALHARDLTRKVAV